MGKSLTLTPTEFSILQILLESKGTVVSAEELFYRIWADEYYSKTNNTITSHIRHLREKLNDTMDNQNISERYGGSVIKLKIKFSNDYATFRAKIHASFLR